MLDVRCSTFISFFIDLTGRFFGRRPGSYGTSIYNKKTEVEPRAVSRHMQGIVIVLVVVLVLVLEIESTKTASRTTTSTSTSTIQITNKIRVPQPPFDPKKFLFQSNWPFFDQRQRPAHMINARACWCLAVPRAP